MTALKPCPFCEGPPVPMVQDSRGLGATDYLPDYGYDGLDVRAFVFCHECGAEGPEVEATLYEASDYRDAEAAAVRLWQARDKRHRVLFDAGEAEGLNLYPRDDPQWSITDAGRALIAGTD